MKKEFHYAIWAIFLLCGAYWLYTAMSPKKKTPERTAPVNVQDGGFGDLTKGQKHIIDADRKKKN